MGGSWRASEGGRELASERGWEEDDAEREGSMRRRTTRTWDMDMGRGHEMAAGMGHGHGVGCGLGRGRWRTTDMDVVHLDRDAARLGCGRA